MILAGGDEDRMSGVTRQAAAALRAQLGLDRPFWQQYLDWIWGLLHLDAGISLWSGSPVFDEIMQRLPLTLQMAAMALIVSLVVAIPIGIVSALKQDTWLDYLFRTFSIAGLALPGFWIGTLLLLFMTVWFNWTPPLGYVDFFADPWVNMQQLIWPALIIGYGNAAVIARMTRSAMLEVMREDYIRTAWAKGLNLRVILSVHALRNALLPVLTLAGIELGQLLSGTVIMETIFSLPGMGRFLVNAIYQRDYPVVQTVILIMGIKFVLLNLLVDILYSVLDPRIRYR